MKTSISKMIEPLERAQTHPGPLDKVSVETALSDHFAALGLTLPKIHWCRDGVEGFVDAALSKGESSQPHKAYYFSLRATWKVEKEFLLLDSVQELYQELADKAFDKRWASLDGLIQDTAYSEAHRTLLRSGLKFQDQFTRPVHSYAIQAPIIEFIKQSISFYPDKDRDILEPKSTQTCVVLYGAALATIFAAICPLVKSHRSRKILAKLYEILGPLVKAYQSGLWLYWVKLGKVIAVPRPIVHTSEDARLHCETAPAVQWPAGAIFWFLHNVQVTEQTVLHPETLSADQILEEPYSNARELMIARHGAPGKLLQMPNGERLAEQEWLSFVKRAALRSEDERGRLHAETGPAIGWHGGPSWYFWHGVRISERIILHPETITADEILAEENVEVRRVLLERRPGGLARLVHERGEPLEVSSGGTLYQLCLADGWREPHLRMVEVTCPSTQNKYLLRVPPDTRSVQEAIAWSFDLLADEYRPRQET